jgi:NADH:ubiquinone reductase (H+-translocating)
MRQSQKGAGLMTPQMQLDRADRMTGTGLFMLRIAAGLLFLLPGLSKFADPATFAAMLDSLPAFLEPYHGVLFHLVAWSEVIGGVFLIAGFNVRLAVAPLVVIILVASFFVVRFDHSSQIRLLSLSAHAMAFGMYSALFFLGSGRWALDRKQNLIRFIANRRWGAASRLAGDLVSGWSRNRGVFLLRAATAFPFLFVALIGIAGAQGQIVLPGDPWLRGLALGLSLIGGLSVLTGFRTSLMAWPLIGLTATHLVFVAIPDAASSQIGTINILFHVVLVAALLALRLIRLGSDLEIGHILSGNRRNIVVIGGGFAATSLVRRLEGELPREYRIILIAEENYTVFNPLLAELVGATIQPAHTIAPIRRMIRRSRFIQAQVTGIDFDARELHYRAGEDSETLSWEHVVIAPGARAKLDLLPGMAEHALPFKLLGDALRLRNRVIEQLEAADRCEDDEQRAWLGHFIIMGAGFSGVEVAGAIHDFVHEACKAYPLVDGGDLSVTLVHGTDCPLPEMPRRLGEYTARNMRARGIDLRLETRAKAVDARGIELDGGERIEGATIVSTIGTQPNPLVLSLGLPTERGRITAQGDMSVPGFAGVWAMGDAALVPNAHDGQPAPPTAQFAVHQGRKLADNLMRSLRARPTRPLDYRSRGAMASIGAQNGIADLFGGLTLTGLPAWLLWRAYYLSLMPTVLKKVQIFFEWTWGMAFSADITNLRFTRSRDADGEAETRAAPDGGRVD